MTEPRARSGPRALRGAGPLIDDLPWYMREIQWIAPLGDEESRELRRGVRGSLIRNA